MSPTPTSISYVLRKSTWVGTHNVDDELMDDVMADFNPFAPGEFDIDDEIMDDVMEDVFDVVDDLAVLFAQQVSIKADPVDDELAVLFAQQVSIKADPVDELASLFSRISM